MRIRLSEFKKIINKFISEALEELETEDVDRLNRARDGYGETEFEEDVDRLRRAKDGYGESEFEESAGMMMQSQPCSQETEAAGVGPKNPIAQPQNPSSSAALHTRDKSQMKGVGPRPTMANAFGDEKKEAAAPPSAPQSSKVRVKDKSKMQGVGPRPTMATAFGDQSQQKQEDDEFNPNITKPLPPEENPNMDQIERDFMMAQKAKKVAADREQIKKVLAPNAFRGMEKDGHKPSTDAAGNKYFTTKHGEKFQNESSKIKKRK